MSRGSKESHGLEVFPFLAVLICTMGSLIFLLLVTTRQARERAINLAKFQRAQQRQAKLNAAATVALTRLPTISIPGPIAVPVAEPEPEPESEPESEEPEVDPNEERKAEYERALAEREREIEELKKTWDQKNRQLVKVRDRERAELLQRRATMKETSEQSDSLKADLDSLETQIGKLSQQAAAALLKAADDAEQKAIERQVAEMKRRLRAAQMKESSGDNSKFQVVPFDPQTGTTRRPILIECTGLGIRILPEGITITPADLEGFTPKANPIAAATGAIINYWNAKNAQKKDSRTEPEPYVLLLVRPDGIFGYYVAMKYLEPIRTAHGYELLEDQTVLQLPEVDPEARAAGINAIERLIAERDELNRSPRGRSGGGSGSSDGGGGGRPQRKSGGGRAGSGVVHAAGDGIPGGQPGGGGNTFSMDDLTGRERSVGDRSWERIENFEGQPRGRRSAAGGSAEGAGSEAGQIAGDSGSGSGSGRTGRNDGRNGNNANAKGGSGKSGSGTSHEAGVAGTSAVGGFSAGGFGRGAAGAGGTGPAGTSNLGAGGGQPGGGASGRPGSALDNPDSVLNADGESILPPGVEPTGQGTGAAPGFGTASVDGNQTGSGGSVSTRTLGGQAGENGGNASAGAASAFGDGMGGVEGGGGQQSGRALDNPDAVLNADNSAENSQPRNVTSSNRKSVFGMTKMPGEEGSVDGAEAAEADGSSSGNAAGAGRGGQGGIRAANGGSVGGSARGGSSSNGASGGWQPQDGQSSSGSMDDYGPAEPGMPIGQRPKRKKKTQQYSGSSGDDQSSGSDGDASGQSVSQRQAENEALLATRGPSPSADQVASLHRNRRPRKSNDEPKALEPELIAGRRWGISEPGASIGFEREVRVDVYPDRFVIADRFDISNNESDSKQEVFEDFIKTLERHSREWGRPPTGFFWTPRLKFVVKPDANLQYEQINTLMNRSGLSTAREFTKSAEKQYGREANWTKPASAKKDANTPVGAKP